MPFATDVAAHLEEQDYDVTFYPYVAALKGIQKAHDNWCLKYQAEQQENAERYAYYAKLGIAIPSFQSLSLAATVDINRIEKAQIKVNGGRHDHPGGSNHAVVKHLEAWGKLFSLKYNFDDQKVLQRFVSLAQTLYLQDKRKDAGVKKSETQLGETADFISYR